MLEVLRITLIPVTALSASAAGCNEQSSMTSTSMSRLSQVSAMLFRHVYVSKCWP